LNPDRQACRSSLYCLGYPNPLSNCHFTSPHWFLLNKYMMYYYYYYWVTDFLFSMSPGPALGSTQPPNQWVSGALSPGVKRPGCEADHSPPASAEVKKMWIYTSTPLYAFMA
jgi:hypothetical protein